MKSTATVTNIESINGEPLESGKPAFLVVEVKMPDQLGLGEAVPVATLKLPGSVWVEQGERPMVSLLESGDFRVGDTFPIQINVNDVDTDKIS